MNRRDLPADIGERNVERLLDAAYQPEFADPEFVRRTHARLLAVAREAAQARGKVPPRAARLRRFWALGAAALLAGLLFGLDALLHQKDQRPPAHSQPQQVASVPRLPVQDQLTP